MSRATDKLLVARARAQHGLLGEADAIRLTVRDDALSHLVSGGLWQEVLQGVLAPAAVDVSRELVERAAMLWIPRCSLSHYSAARREGIWVPDNDQAWVTAEFDCARRSQATIKVFRSRQFPLDFRTDGFHRWTPPARTVVDLASVLTRKQLDAVLLSAIRLDKTTAPDVDDAAAGLRGRKGIAMLRETTSLWTPERESLLEDLLHGDVLHVVGPDVTRQHKVLRADGSVFARLDVAIEELLLGFEADGLLYHSTDEQIAGDQKRDRTLMGRGWQIARFREGSLDDRVQVRREIRAIVEQRRRQLRVA
jgi:very-short-patch-repair endonuclease